MLFIYAIRSIACSEKDLTDEESPLSLELDVVFPILLKKSSFYLINC